MVRVGICTSEGRGDRSGEWSLHTLTWMRVSETLAGITGETQRMREVLAFMSTGTSSEISLLYQVVIKKQMVDDVLYAGALVRVAARLDGLPGREN